MKGDKTDGYTKYIKHLKQDTKLGIYKLVIIPV